MRCDVLKQREGIPLKTGEYPQATLQEHQQALIKLLEEFDRVCRALDIPYILFAGSMLGAVRHQGFIPWDDDIDVMMLRPDYERFLQQADSVLDQQTFFLQKEFSRHWPMYFSKLRLNETACLEKYHPKDPASHQGVYIDIFPCDNAAKTGFGRNIQFLASKVVIAKGLDRRGYATNSVGKKLFMAFCRILPGKLFLKLSRGGSDQSEKVHSFYAAARGYGKNVYPRSLIAQRKQARFEGKSYPIAQNHDTLLRILYGDYMQIPPPEKRVHKGHTILVDLNNSYEKYENYRDGMKFDVYTRSIR